MYAQIIYIFILYNIVMSYVLAIATRSKSPAGVRSEESNRAPSVFQLGNFLFSHMSREDAKRVGRV